MKRAVRIAFEVLAPPLFGALPFYLAAGTDLIAHVVYEHDAFRGETFVLFAGPYLVAGIPSAIYAVLMELAFSRFLKPKDWSAVLVSTVLGLFAGLLIGALTASLSRDHHHRVFNSLLTMVPLGAFAGFLTGICVKAMSGSDATFSQVPEPSANTRTLE